ncbi:hypothetical protein [Streptomyces ossamyceticus]|uniref:hypothetical protein n=1 Tax=Streptomyces ossamyceticus TaxID=249581 RepID=UPI0006E15D69|nr:hypothetical protein [Streptomyces ossamyceticus]
MSRVPGTVALTALPLALLAGAAAAGPTSAATTAALAPKATFVLDADTGTFTTSGVSAKSSDTKVVTLASLDGAATDARVLEAGGTQVLANTTFANAPDRNARAAWAAGSRFVDLSWPDIEGDGTYTVHKNGRVIATTSEHSLRDTNVTPGEEARYAISGRAGDNGHNWSFTVSVPLSSDRATLAATAKQADAKARNYLKTKVVYRVFIGAKTVKIGKAAGIAARCKYYGDKHVYKGDNRNFSSKISGPGYRARLEGNISWKRSKYEFFRATGKSHVLNRKGKVIATKHASAKKIDFRAMSKFNGKTRDVRGVIEAGNPFCKAGAASGIFNARLARNGDFYLSGKHKQAPNHEIYFYGYTSTKKHTTKSVLRFRQSNPACVANGACRPSPIQNNGSY